MTTEEISTRDATPPKRVSPGDSAVRAAIARSITDIHRRAYGRGPRLVRVMGQRAMVVAVLLDVFTPSERTMIRHGSLDQVRATRRELYDALSSELCESVHEATGYEVKAFLHDTHPSGESALVFILA